MSPDKFFPYGLLTGGAQSPRLHRRLDGYMRTWALLSSLFTNPTRHECISLLFYMASEQLSHFDGDEGLRLQRQALI